MSRARQIGLWASLKAELSLLQEGEKQPESLGQPILYYLLVSVLVPIGHLLGFLAALGAFFHEHPAEEAPFSLL